jgi:hypothetical protein
MHATVTYATVMHATDARGTRHRRCDDHGKLRIVSLVPPLTELLCDLGLGAQVVGRTGSCVHPADEVARITTVDRGDVPDRPVDIEKVRQLAPTHLVVNDDENDPSTIAALEAFVPHVVVARPRAPRDNLGLYRLFGHVFACEREADRLCARFEAAWEMLMDAQRAMPQPPRRVLVLIGSEPWTTIACDTYMARVLASIGWHQVDVEPEARDDVVPWSPRRPAIDLGRATRDVDLVVLSCGPYPFTGSHVALLTARGLDAKLVDGEGLSRYGSHAIAGLGYLGMLATAL